MPKRAYASAAGYRSGGPFQKRKKAAPKMLRAAVRKAVYGLAEKKINIAQIDEDALSTVGAGGNWLHVTNLTQASSDASRVGRSITLDSVRVRGVLNSNNSINNTLVRMVIGYFNDFTAPSSSTPLFEGSGGYQAAQTFGVSGTSNGLNCIYQPLSSQHFTCISDRVFTISVTGSLDAGNVKYFDVTKSLRGTKIQFDGASVGSGTNLKKALYVGWWAAEAADDTGVGSTVEISAAALLKYTDL